MIGLTVKERLSADLGASGVTVYVIGIELLKSDAAQMVALGYPIEDGLVFF